MTAHPIPSAVTAVERVPDFSEPHAGFRAEETIIRKDYGRIRLRPIRLDDQTLLTAFHARLSPRNVYLRYFYNFALEARIQHERLAHVCANTSHSHAIVMERLATKSRPPEILAIGRLSTTETPGIAAFTTLFCSELLNSELPCDLMARLMAVARAHGFHTLIGDMLAGDRDSLNLCRGFNFVLHSANDDGLIHVSHAL
jgi:acetyltransferase